MKKILFTNSSDVSLEVNKIEELFDLGLDLLHIRKPHHTIEKLRKYIGEIDQKYHSQIVLHDHFELLDEFHLKGIHISHENRHGFWFQHFTLKRILSKHKHLSISYTANSIKEYLRLTKKNADYIFLGRIFSTHSISGLNPHFDIDQLIHINKVATTPLYALGGITDLTISKAKQIGFIGIVLHKYIWDSKNPVDAFKMLLQILNMNQLNQKQA